MTGRTPQSNSLPPSTRGESTCPMCNTPYGSHSDTSRLDCSSCHYPLERNGSEDPRNQLSIERAEWMRKTRYVQQKVGSSQKYSNITHSPHKTTPIATSMQSSSSSVIPSRANPSDSPECANQERRSGSNSPQLDQFNHHVSNEPERESTAQLIELSKQLKEKLISKLECFERILSTLEAQLSQRDERIIGILGAQLSQRDEHIFSALEAKLSQRDERIFSALEAQFSQRDERIFSALETKLSQRDERIFSDLEAQFSQRDERMFSDLEAQLSRRDGHIVSTLQAKLSQRDERIISSLEAQLLQRDERIIRALEAQLSQRNERLQFEIISQISTTFTKQLHKQLQQYLQPNAFGISNHSVDTSSSKDNNDSQLSQSSPIQIASVVQTASKAPLSSERAVVAHDNFNSLSLAKIKTQSTDNQRSNAQFLEDCGEPPAPSWLDRYNYEPKCLTNYATVIAETEDSKGRRRGGAPDRSVYLEPNPQGAFWMIPDFHAQRDQKFYLVLKDSFALNQFNQDSIRQCFDSLDPLPMGKRPIIIRAALLSPQASDNQWKLIKRGKLKSSIN